MIYRKNKYMDGGFSVSKCINKMTGVEYNFIINNCEKNKNNIYDLIKSISSIPIKIVNDKIHYINYNYEHVINKDDILLSKLSDNDMIYIVSEYVFKNDFKITD